MELVNFILQYIPLDYVLIIGGLIVIGEMFKRFTTLPNYFLTTLLPTLGAIIMGVIYITGADILVTADFIKQICIGLLIGWASTGGYEWFKNTFLKDKEEKKVIAIESINSKKENTENIEGPEKEVSEEVKEKVKENN